MEQKDWSCNLGITLNSSPPNLNNRLEVKARVCKKKKYPSVKNWLMESWGQWRTRSLKPFPSYTRGIPGYSMSRDLVESWECPGQRQQLA